MPLTIDPARENRGNHVIRVVGRLRPGVSLDRARDEMRRIAAAMEQEFPATNKDWSVRLETLYDSMLDERVRPSLLVLLAAVGMVLLIACANVANVLLARGIARQRELALRTALGAGRSRLVRQLVTESVCLAVVSGTCGLLLAVFAVQTLRVMLPPTLPRIDEISVDATVLGLGLLLSLASGLFMGLVPAVRASRVALVPSLAQQGKGVAGLSGTFVRHAIVVAQMALATMLLVGAALLLQSFVRLQHVRPGFDPNGVITARISLPGAQYPDAARTVGLLGPPAGIARRHVAGTVRGGRNHGAIRARRARGRDGAGPCPRASTVGCGDRGCGAHGESRTTFRLWVCRCGLAVRSVRRTAWGRPWSPSSARASLVSSGLAKAQLGRLSTGMDDRTKWLVSSGTSAARTGGAAVAAAWIARPVPPSTCPRSSSRRGR